MHTKSPHALEELKTLAVHNKHHGKTLHGVASNRKKGADACVLGFLNFAALTGHCVVFQKLMYFFKKSNVLKNTLGDFSITLLSASIQRL
jgi:hypothetical protein